MLKTYEVKPVASGGDWAVIVLDTERGFLGIASDRGNYAFMWSHTGEDDFRSFLIGLEDSPDYLLGKLMHGRPDRQVYDGVTPLPCRRCSECPDALHHWLPVCDPGEEPCWGCKHCDHTCESVACEACDEEIPIDIGAYVNF